ncbi:MAG: diguanylate cyclase [Bdellovibrio sp.]|nr:diguanylate cyclase [Bdellovibrio sp.]
MISARNLSVFLFSWLSFFAVGAAGSGAATSAQTTAKFVSKYPGFESSLQRLNTLQASPTCPLLSKLSNSTCPKILTDLVQDEAGDRALGLVKNNVKMCSMPLELKDPNLNRDLLKNTGDLQKAFQSNPNLDLGDYSNSTISACQSLPASVGVPAVSKFYYYGSRLNAASGKAAQESALIAKLLGKAAPECPPSDILNAANKICNEMKSCAQATTLDQLASKATNDEQIYSEFVDQLKKLPAKCDEDKKCKATKDAYSAAVLGLAEMNPWFLNDDFRQDKRKKPMKERLKTYLESSQKALADQSKKIQEAAACIHGSRTAQCNLDQLRETLSNTPELGSIDGIRKDQYVTSKLISVQSCTEQWTLEKNRVGKVMTDLYWDVGVTISTFGLGAIATAGKSAYIGRGSQLARMMGLGAESLNLSLDVFNAGTGIAEAIKSCVSKSVDLTQSSKNKICTANGSALSRTDKSHGSCAVQAGLSAAGVLAVIPGGIRIAKILKESNYMAETKAITAEVVSVRRAETAATRESRAASSSSASSAIGEAEDAVGGGKKLTRSGDKPKKSSGEKRIASRVAVPESAQKVTAIESPTVANLPETMKLSQVEKADGSKTMIYEMAEKLPDGRYVRTSGEVPIDEVSGAINANFSSGRKFFDDMAEAKAGKAFLAFVDVGMLGAVNNKFKAGTAAGDRYLKAVADEILKAGESKMTLARLGGDEFGLIIDSINPAEVKRILEKIQSNIRKNLDGDAHQVFREEKIVRAKNYKEKMDEVSAGGLLEPTKKEKLALREDIDELAKIQQPDISIGSAQIGHGDDIRDLQQVAEDQAKQMKIQSALNFGRSAEKYGSDAIPSSRPNPMYMAPIEEAVPSAYWSKSVPAAEKVPALSSLPAMNVTAVEEVKRVGSITLIRAEDELGRSTYQVEHYLKDAAGATTKITKELPVNGSTGLLDARHPEAQKIILEQIQTVPDTAILMPKLTSLKYFNYFEDGSAAGDEVLKIVADTIKKDMRATDLSMKLGGADFLWSVNKGAADSIAQIALKINDDVAKNPAFKVIIEKERTAIVAKLAEVKSMTVAGVDQTAERKKEIEKLNQRLKEIKNFKPDIQLQAASQSEIRNLNFDQITTLMDDKFKAARSAGK